MGNGTSINIYEAVISDLESKIAAMQSMIDNLRAMSGGVGPVTGLAAAQHVVPQANGAAFAHDAFFGMTVADGAKKFLAATKKTATVGTIGEALVAGGWKTAAKNIPENIRSILSRTPEFVRINGEFGLAEWYPGRKTASKKNVYIDTNVFADSEGSVRRSTVTDHNPIEDIDIATGYAFSSEPPR
jgi:hypothetical protein